MINIDLNPEDRKLIQFGWVGLFAFALTGFLVANKQEVFDGANNWTIPVVLWVLSALCPLMSVFCPRALFPIYIILSIIAIPIGYIVSNLIVTIIFYLFIVPIGIYFRIIGRDELFVRTEKRSKESYWVCSTTTKSLKSYFRQF